MIRNQILLTGAQGFLGKIIQEELSNYSILTLGSSEKNAFVVDIDRAVPNLPNNVDWVIHSAGKAHLVPKSEQEAQAFWDVNWQGTLNLLKGLEQSEGVIKGFVFISTVSVYGLGEGEDISEGTALKGSTPYALSKIKAEEAVEQWCIERSVPYLILRLPLVVGPSPKGNLAKMINGIRSGTYLRIAKGAAKKSMVLGSDVARLIHSWAEQGGPTSGIYNLTDRYHPTFFELEQALQQRLGRSFIPSIPGWLAGTMGRVGDLLPFFPVNSATIQKITCTFTFSDEKAVRELGWSPTPVLEGLDFLKPR